MFDSDEPDVEARREPRPDPPGLIRLPGLALVTPVRLLSAGCLTYALLYLDLTRHFSFFQDEWEFIIDRRAWTAKAFLSPHVQSLAALPVLIDKLLFVTVGLGTVWPYRIPVLVLHLACVVGLFVLARRRAGGWRALIPAGLLLVLGAAFEDTLWEFQMTFLISVAGGIWALICIDRGTRRGNLAAALLVGAGLASSSVGLPFALAIGAELALRRARSLWIVIVPVALYGIWYLHYGQSTANWNNGPHVLAYDFQIGGYAFAGLIGLSALTFGVGGWVLVVGDLLLVGVVGWLVRRATGGRSLPPRAVAGIVGALALWTTTALARWQYHQPDSSQYIYPGVVFILLCAIAIMSWWPLSVRGAAAIAGAGALIALAGFVPMRQYAIDRDSVDRYVETAFAAAQLTGAAGDPAAYPNPSHLGYVTLGAYLAAVRALGSPAYPVAALLREPTAYRQLADRTLIALERITAQPVPRPDLAGCRRLGPDRGAARAGLTVGAGTLIDLSTRGSHSARIWLRRISSSYPPAAQWTLDAGRDAALRLPADASTLPWHLRVVTAGAARRGVVIEDCSLATQGP